MKIKIEDKNLLDYSDWTTGTTGSEVGFTYFSNLLGNTRIEDTGPYGEDAVIWKAYSGTTTGNFSCGFNTGNITRNSGYTYRHSMWVKKTSIGSTQGDFYFAPIHYPLTYVTTGGGGAIYYYHLENDSEIDTYLPTNEWRLLVGHYRPIFWTGTTNHEDSGIWTTGGTMVRVDEIIDIKSTSAADITTRVRVYAPYVGQNNYQFAYPRIDVLDGTEPSIATLLNNEGMWRDVQATKIKIEDKNLLDYSDWTPIEFASDYDSTFPNFVSREFGSAQNSIIYDTDPYGNTALIWKMSGTSATSRGWWNNNTTNDMMVPVSPNNDYRYSLWMKISVLTGANRLYSGLFAYDENYTASGLTSVASGSYSNAPYFYGSTNIQNYIGNEWCLLVGYVYNSGWTGTTNTTTLYDITGGTINTFNTWKMPDTIRYLKNFHCFLYDSLCETYSVYPRIDLIDGTEPSIETLLNNEGMWRDVEATKINIGGTWEDAVG